MLAITHKHATDAIKGGMTAKLTDFPFIVHLYTYNFPSCVGTLIAPDMLVTSGRCIDYGNRPSVYHVLGFGDYGARRDMINVKKIFFLEPTYNIKTLVNDIVVFQTESPFPGTPIKLPTQGQDFTGMNGTMLGVNSEPASYGNLINLNQIQFTFMANSMCDVEYNNRPNQNRVFFEQTNICVMDQKQKAFPCRADDSDPMVVQVGSDLVLAGILSYGTHCGSVSAPFVGTRISAFTDHFLKKVVEKYSQQ